MAEKEWMGGTPERNKMSIDRVERFRTSELGAECWKKTLTDIKSGWLATPEPLTEKIAGATNLTPRYAIYEKPGNGPRKVTVYV